MNPIAPLAVTLLALSSSPASSHSSTSSSVSSGDAADSVVRVYDLRAVTPVFDSNDEWEQSLVMSPSGFNHSVERVDLVELHERASADIVVDLIGQVFGDELRYEGRELSLTGDSKLIVLAPEEVHARVAELLGMLERVLSTEVDMAVEVIEVPDGMQAPSAGLVEQAEAERLIANLQRAGAPHASYETRLYAGRTTGIDVTKSSGFLIDYDVEIAQGAAVFDPIIGHAEEGTRLFLRGVPSGEGLFLTLVFQEAHLVDGTEFETIHAGGNVWFEGGQNVIDDALQVQKVTSFQRCFAFDTYLPPGKAIVAYSEVDSGPAKSRQVVVLRRRGGDRASSFHDVEVPGTTRRLLAVNTEFFNPPRLDIGGPWAADEDSRGSEVLLNARVSSEPSLFFFDWFKRRFTVWRRLGPWALAVTDPAWDDQGAKELRDLVAGWQPEARVSTVDARLHRSADPVAPVRWVVPVRSGSGCAARIGLASVVLTDYDVEVAQMASVNDPVLAIAFDGLAISMATSHGGSGTLSLDMHVLAQLADGPMPRLETTSQFSNLFDLPAFQRLNVEERVNFLGPQNAPFRVRLGDSGQAADAGLQLEVVLK